MLRWSGHFHVSLRQPGKGGHRPPFRRVLFVAHREEILGQAWRTFRRIRPLATLGYYNGRGKAPEEDVTATPERTDGADLLTLCGDNLVYRADMAEGIRRGLPTPNAFACRTSRVWTDRASPLV